jgi:hypothetical protein
MACLFKTSAGTASKIRKEVAVDAKSIFRVCMWRYADGRNVGSHARRVVHGMGVAPLQQDVRFAAIDGSFTTGANFNLTDLLLDSPVSAATPEPVASYCWARVCSRWAAKFGARADTGFPTSSESLKRPKAQGR